MGKYNTLILEFDDEGNSARLTINRPKKKNCMSPEFHYEIDAALTEVEEAGEVKVLVLTGVGDSFCCGMDLENCFLEPFSEPKEFERINYAGLNWFERLKYFPSVTLASVNGYCFGGGMLVVGVCDLAISAEEAIYGLSEVNFGIFPGGGTMWTSAHNMVRKQALYYSMTAERFNGIRAEELGYVNKAVPLRELDKETDRVVSMLVDKNYNTLRSCKEVYEKSIFMHFGESKEWELAKLFEMSYLTEDEWINKALTQFKRREYRPGMKAYKLDDSKSATESDERREDQRREEGAAKKVKPEKRLGMERRRPGRWQKAKR